MKRIKVLLEKEIQLEFQNKGSLYSNILFVIASTYIAYSLLGTTFNLKVWSALYWIIMLYTSISIAISTSNSENRRQLAYLYNMIKPHEFIISRIIWNTVFILSMNLLALFLWKFLGVDMENVYIFSLCLVLNSILFASLLSLVSFIGKKAGGGFAMMAILSIPLLVPDLMLISKLSILLIDDFESVVFTKYIFGLTGLTGMCFVLALIMFSYIWKE